jgi:hypothetical protein
MPGTTPSDFWLTVSSADGASSLTFWQGGDAQTVQYSSGGETAYWLVAPTDGTTGIAEAMRAEYDNLDVLTLWISFYFELRKGDRGLFVREIYGKHLWATRPAHIQHNRL